MAMIFGPEGAGQFTIGQNLPVPYQAPQGAGYAFGQRLAALLRGRMGSVLKGLPAAGLATEGVADLADENGAGATARLAGATGAVLGGVPGRAFAGGLVGGELAASTVGAVAENSAANQARNQVLTPGFQKTVDAGGGTDKFVQGVRDRTIAGLEAQDVAAQRVADARTARVNEVIAGSREQTQADAAPTVDFGKAGNFATLTGFFGDVANRVAYNNAVRAAQVEKLTSRKLDIEGLKAMAAATKPDIKIATVKQGLNEIPVLTRDGQPTLSLTANDKGQVMPQTVLQPVNREQLLALAREKFKRAATRSEEKQIQDELKARGITEKLTK